MRFALSNSPPSFRDGPKDQTRESRYSGFDAYARPGMTERSEIEGHMTITTTIDGSKGKFDWTKPVLAVFAVCLILLIVLPLSWLAVYSVTDKAGRVPCRISSRCSPTPISSIRC